MRTITGEWTALLACLYGRTSLSYTYILGDPAPPFSCWHRLGSKQGAPRGILQALPFSKVVRSRFEQSRLRSGVMVFDRAKLPIGSISGCFKYVVAAPLPSVNDSGFAKKGVPSLDGGACCPVCSPPQSAAWDSAFASSRACRFAPSSSGGGIPSMPRVTEMWGFRLSCPSLSLSLSSEKRRARLLPGAGFSFLVLPPPPLAVVVRFSGTKPRCAFGGGVGARSSLIRKATGLAFSWCSVGREEIASS